MFGYLAAAALLFSSPAAAEFSLHWGNEVLSCGTSRFETTIGDGKDVLLKHVVVEVSGSPINAVSTWSTATLKQSLVILGYNPPPNPGGTTKVVTALVNNNEVDAESIVALNPKTYGLNPVRRAKTRYFDPALLIPKGFVWLRVDTIVPGTLYDNAASCFNTETHIEFYYQPAAP